MNTHDKAIWIGLVHVKPKNKCEILEGGKGAYVQILALAENADEYISYVIDFVNSYELNIKSIEDIQLFNDCTSHVEANEKIKIIASNITEENPVDMGTIHIYVN